LATNESNKEYKYFLQSIDKFKISSYHNNMKKFWKYFIILILLLAGLFCVGLLYLFFVPDSTLFNIKYIGYSEKFETGPYSTEGISTIELNSRAYDINIIPSESSEISVTVKAKSFGYVLEKNSHVDVSSSISGNTLTIDVTEPHGLAANGFSSIDLKLPKNYSPNLVLKNKKADVLIQSESISINNLTYKSNSGRFDFKSGSINGEMNLTLNSAVFNLGSSVNVNENNLTLSLTSGKFNASTHSFKNVKVTKNTRGIVDIKNCSSFVEKVESAGGKIVIDSVLSVNIESSDTNVDIKNLYGGTIILTRTGSVKIDHLQGISLIKTKSGSISINKASAKFSTETTTGNQNLKNLTYFVEAVSTYGNINVEFANDAGNYNFTDAIPLRSLTATTTSGKITVKGVEHIKILVKDNGRVDVNMNNVLGDGNQIIGKRGSVNVVIANDAIYGLTTESTEGSVYVNVGQFAVNGYTTTERTFNIICPFEGAWVPAGYLEVSSTSGSIRIVDVMNN